MYIYMSPKLGAGGWVDCRPRPFVRFQAWRNVRALQPQPHESDDRYGGQEQPGWLYYGCFAVLHPFFL